MTSSTVTSSRIRLLTSCSRQRHTTVLVLFATGVVFGQVSFQFMIARVQGGDSSWCGYLLEKRNSGTNATVIEDFDTSLGDLRRAAESISTTTDDSSLATPPELLFVGVMTSRRYLRTRARAIHETWGQAAQQNGGSLVFFVGGGDNVTDSDVDGPPLRVQVLPDVVDSEYPPRRKSFAMLDWMHRNHGQRYDWYMRADDDLFVDVSRLRALLSSLDASAPLYLGHPGTGKADEEGRLGLSSGAPYCMGGTGVLVSREMLTSLAGKLSGCLENTASDHEDSELGRCIYNVTGVACVQSERIYRRFKQNYEDTSGEWIRRALKTPRAYVTYHPVKDTRYMYYGAALMESQRVVKLQTKVRQLEADVACLGELTRFSQAVGASSETPIGDEGVEVEMEVEAELKEGREETPCSDGNNSEETAALPAASRGPACELGTRRLRFPPRTGCLHPSSNNSLSLGGGDKPWSQVHGGSFHAPRAIGFTMIPAAHAGVLEGLTLMLRHLSRYVSAVSRREPALDEGGEEAEGGRDHRRPPRSRWRHRPSFQRSRLVAVDLFYRRVEPSIGVEYVTFLRGEKSPKLRPYVVRQEFDTPVVTEKLRESVVFTDADEELNTSKGDFRPHSNADERNRTKIAKKKIFDRWLI